MSSLKEKGRVNDCQCPVIRAEKTDTHFRIAYWALLGSSLKDINGVSGNLNLGGVCAPASPSGPGDDERALLAVLCSTWF